MASKTAPAQHQPMHISKSVCDCVTVTVACGCQELGMLLQPWAPGEAGADLLQASSRPS